MKDEVTAFKKDFGKGINGKGERFLFIVWFGANDLYTAGLPPTQMGSVAIKIASKRRNEIAALVGPQYAKFVFANLGMPLSAARYQEKFDRQQQKSRAAEPKQLFRGIRKENVTISKGFAKVRKEMNNFESGVTLFNKTLKETAESNGDTYVDMASVVSKESVSALLDQLGLVEGVQETGTSDGFVTADLYDHIDSPMQISTSDKAHPTDRVYRLMWEKMRETFWEKKYSFGNLPS